MEGGEICSKDSDDSNGKDEETERKSNEGNNVKKVYEKKCVKRNISKENAIDDVCQVDEKIEIKIVDEPLETDEIRNGAVNFSSSPVLHLDRLCPPVSTPVNDQDDRVKGTDSSVIFSYNTHKEKFDILPSCSGTSEVISSDHNNEKAIVSEKMPSLLMDCITEDLSSVQVSRVKKAQIYFSMFQSFVSKMQQESEDDGVEQSLVDENSSQISNIPTNSDNDADSIKLKKSGVPEVAAAKERLTSAYQKCTKCAYSTCCRIMINKHAQVFHPEKSHSSAYGIGPPIILPEPLHCTCGFSSRSGNHLEPESKKLMVKKKYLTENAAQKQIKTKQALPQGMLVSAGEMPGTSGISTSEEVKVQKREKKKNTGRQKSMNTIVKEQEKLTAVQEQKEMLDASTRWYMSLLEKRLGHQVFYQ